MDQKAPEEEVVVGEYEVEDKPEETAPAGPPGPPPPQPQQVVPGQQMPLFPGGGIQRMEKKLAKGKKVTAQESMKAAMEMRQMFGAAIQDLQKVVMKLQAHEQGISHLFANINCLIELLIRKEVFTEQEYKDAWEELVVKPQEKAKEEMLEKMKEEGAKAAAAAKKEEDNRKHPDCHYCGKDDCEFCNPPEEKKEECCSTDDGDECQECKCEAPPLADPEE
jgi:hypothetical protein